MIPSTAVPNEAAPEPSFPRKAKVTYLKWNELWFRHLLSACRTRSSHSRICPIRLFVRLTRAVAARKERAVERSIAILPWSDIRFHLGANLRAKLTSSEALLLSRASSFWILSLERFFIASARAFFYRPSILVPSLDVEDKPHW